MIILFSEPGRQCVDDLGNDRLQDQVVGLGPGHLVGHPQCLLQRLVERARIQAHEGLSQIRFLPGNYTFTSDANRGALMKRYSIYSGDLNSKLVW